MPAVLNDTPSTGTSRLSWPDSRRTTAASGSGQLSCGTPGSLAVGERERLRETAETARFASEEARMAAETARTASEEARVATDAARHDVVDAVRATADALNASLEQMQVVEDMRRTLREIRDVNKLDSN